MPWTKADQLYRSTVAACTSARKPRYARRVVGSPGPAPLLGLWRRLFGCKRRQEQGLAVGSSDSRAKLMVRPIFFLQSCRNAWKQNMRRAAYPSSWSSCCYWKPVTVGSHKGQVFVKWLAVTIGGSQFIFRSVASADDDAAAAAKWIFGEPSSTGLALSHTDMQMKKTTLTKKAVEGVLLVCRAVYLLVLFTPALVLAFFALDKPDGRLRKVWLDILLKSLECAGPAFIKWGQWAATRPDMFPVDICQQLSKLHSQAPAHSFSETRRIIEKAFHLPLDRLFEDFSRDPIASGSIAQVHKAVLRTKGQKPLVVAVKVRHPRVSKVIQRDFAIMNWVAKASTNIAALEHLQLDKTVQQFATFMTKQVDLTLEATHLMRFIYNFRQWRNVSFPRPIYPLVHPEVLVETFEEGRSIQEFIEETQKTKFHSQLARLGSSMLLKMLLSDNFIHGDLHPGNMFVKLGGKFPKLVLLDAGMTAELSQRNRYILLELFKALSDKDGAQVARSALELSENQTCTDVEGFISDVDKIFKGYLAVRGTSKMGDYISELFEQVRRYRVNLDGEVCTVMVTVVILEGWQRKLDMSLDIMRMVKELLFKAEWTATFEYVMGAIAAP